MQKDLENIICAEKVSHMLSQNTRSVLVSAVLCILLLDIQTKHQLSDLHIYIRAFALAVISFARVIVARYFIKHPATTTKQLKKRLNVLRAGIITSATFWGACVYLAGNQQGLELLFFGSFIISGIAAGAAVAYAIDRISALAYVYFAIIPLSIYLVSLNAEITMAMSIAAILYVIFMYFSVNAVNKHLIDNITLRVEAEQHDEIIKQLAFYDVLTGLPNRRLLQDRLTHALNLSARNNSNCAVLFMDLNKFKQLNDTQGHDVGDLLLQQVAERLKKVVRESDTVARLGGDEFVILLENLKGNNEVIHKEINRVAEDIIITFNQPIILKEAPYIASLSIGASIFGKHGNNPNELLKSADYAMYQAKRSGDKRMRIFNASHS